VKRGDESERTNAREGIETVGKLPFLVRTLSQKERMPVRALRPKKWREDNGKSMCVRKNECP